jgi:hypothetical protein
MAVALVTILLPALPAAAAELDELMEESQGATYSAEQLIICETPDGVKNTVIDLQQRGGEIRYGSGSDNETEIWSGHGAWTGPAGGSQIDTDQSQEAEPAPPSLYTLSEGDPIDFLGRPATLYSLSDGDLVRAELVVDDEMGVFLSVVTFDASGAPYCERRFVSFDTNVPDWEQAPRDDGDVLASAPAASMPGILGSFALVDVFSDESGLTFAYYTDGFFSFAVFQSPVPIAAGDASAYVLADSQYQREFAPGQVTYTWPVGTGGMALIGDLPPDMHDEILASLETPVGRGFLNRLWRSIFG